MTAIVEITSMNAIIETNLKPTKKNSDFESIDMLYSALKHWYTDSYTGRYPYNKNEFINYMSKFFL